MHKPPPQDVLDKLMGSVVDTIRFCKFMIAVDFENADAWVIYGPFAFGRTENLKTLESVDFPIVQSDLLRVLRETVVAVSCDDDGTLHLSFSSGDSLIAFANNPQYEAYRLNIEDNEYVV